MIQETLVQASDNLGVGIRYRYISLLVDILSQPLINCYLFHLFISSNININEETTNNGHQFFHIKIENLWILVNEIGISITLSNIFDKSNHNTPNPMPNNCQEPQPRNSKYLDFLFFLLQYSNRSMIHQRNIDLFQHRTYVEREFSYIPPYYFPVHKNILQIISTKLHRIRSACRGIFIFQW